MTAAGATYKHAGVCDLTKPAEDNISDEEIEALIEKL